MRYDLSNKKFGHLTVIKKIGLSKHEELLWQCKCDCGNDIISTSYALRNGLILQCKSCRYKIISQKNKKYIRYSKKLYECYVNLKTRCLNKKQDTKNRYVNRGISICDEWKKSFVNFQEWALANGYKENLTIDRIDNNKGYYPENCRWVDRVVQANNRRTNVILEFNGRKDTMANWSRELKIPYYYLQRYRFKYSIGDIIKKYDNCSRHKGKNK